MFHKLRSLVLAFILVIVCLAPATISSLAEKSAASFSRDALVFLLEGVPALLPAGAPAAGPHIIPIGTATR